MEELARFADAGASGLLFAAGGLPDFSNAFSDVVLLVYALPVLVLMAFAIRFTLWALLSGTLGYTGAKLVSLIMVTFGISIMAATVQTDTVLTYAAGVMRYLVSI